MRLATISFNSTAKRMSVFRDLIEFKMNLKALVFLLILLHYSIANHLECVDDTAIENQCSRYCYSVVKPLLQYAKVGQQRELQFLELRTKIHEQNITISNLKTENLRLAENITNQLEIIALKNKQLELNKHIELQRDLLLKYKQEIEDLIATKCTNSNENVFESTVPQKQATFRQKESGFVSNIKSCIVNKTGIQEMTIHYLQTFPVACDSKFAGSGWTVIQRRKDAGENFNRSWTDYRLGFGDLENNYFIGLEKLHRLTNEQPHELYIYLMSFENETRFARYDLFKIADESENYKILSVGKYSGDAGDSFTSHRNMMFSTYDRDNDVSKYNCANQWLSGWWYNSCFHSNLNGLYKDGVANLQNGIKWNAWENVTRFRFVQMMIRPVVN